MKNRSSEALSDEQLKKIEKGISQLRGILEACGGGWTTAKTIESMLLELYGMKFVAWQRTYFQKERPDDLPLMSPFSKVFVSRVANNNLWSFRLRTKDDTSVANKIVFDYLNTPSRSGKTQQPNPSSCASSINLGTSATSSPVAAKSKSTALLVKEASTSSPLSTPRSGRRRRSRAKKSIAEDVPPSPVPPTPAFSESGDTADNKGESDVSAYEAGSPLDKLKVVLEELGGRGTVTEIIEQFPKNYGRFWKMHFVGKSVLSLKDEPGFNKMFAAKQALNGEWNFHFKVGTDAPIPEGVQRMLKAMEHTGKDRCSRDELCSAYATVHGAQLVDELPKYLGVKDPCEVFSEHLTIVVQKIHEDKYGCVLALERVCPVPGAEPVKKVRQERATVIEGKKRFLRILDESDGPVTFKQLLRSYYSLYDTPLGEAELTRLFGIPKLEKLFATDVMKEEIRVILASEKQTTWKSVAFFERQYPGRMRA